MVPGGGPREGWELARPLQEEVPLWSPHPPGGVHQAASDQWPAPNMRVTAQPGLTQPPSGPQFPMLYDKLWGRGQCPMQDSISSTL